MRVLLDKEITAVSGGNHKPSVFNVIAGFGVSAYERAATALAYEAVESLVDIGVT